MTPAEKALRFPAELQPNPGYRYEPPASVRIDSQRCIEIDAGAITWSRDIAVRGEKLKFPKPQK